MVMFGGIHQNSFLNLNDNIDVVRLRKQNRGGLVSLSGCCGVEPL